jgi:hypothetical protein
MKQSSLTTGIVQGTILTYQKDYGEATGEVYSATWFRWLEQATAFTFHDEVGHFTAHKTRTCNQRGGAYWRATQRRGGGLFSYYLGPFDRLTPDHLVISPRTVNPHTTSLYNKLGVSSRAAATHSAKVHHLLSRCSTCPQFFKSYNGGERAAHGNLNRG